MSETRRIIVITDDLPGDGQQQFATWLGSVGAGWSHWFRGGWLVAAGTYAPGPTVAAIVAKLQEIEPGHACLVFELQGSPVAWQGYLPMAVLEGAKQWMREQWGQIVG